MVVRTRVWKVYIQAFPSTRGTLYTTQTKPLLIKLKSRKYFPRSCHGLEDGPTEIYSYPFGDKQILYLFNSATDTYPLRVNRASL